MGRLITAAVALVTLGVAAAQESRVVVPAVVLEDQFEQVHDVKRLRGDVVVLIYGDKASADANRGLGERLHVHYHPSAQGLDPAQARQAPVTPVPGVAAGTRSPDVKAIPVACVGKVPPLIQKLIRAQIRKGAPNVPVLLDFHDLMKGQFPFKPDVPNAVVLDGHGRYRYAAAGTPTAEGWKQLVAVIDRLRKEAAEGK